MFRFQIDSFFSYSSNRVLQKLEMLGKNWCLCQMVLDVLTKWTSKFEFSLKTTFVPL